mmetsp:Transcript_22611/g.68016  ORF Transcript_22611/g.68016 Transcript_22611/m.68016 type:complete len:237 (-) Transcript_22611:479-1189(-)
MSSVGSLNRIGPDMPRRHPSCDGMSTPFHTSPVFCRTAIARLPGWLLDFRTTKEPGGFPLSDVLVSDRDMFGLYHAEQSSSPHGDDAPSGDIRGTCSFSDAVRKSSRRRRFIVTAGVARVGSRAPLPLSSGGDRGALMGSSDAPRRGDAEAIVSARALPPDGGLEKPFRSPASHRLRVDGDVTPSSSEPAFGGGLPSSQLRPPFTSGDSRPDEVESRGRGARHSSQHLSAGEDMLM